MKGPSGPRGPEYLLPPTERACQLLLWEDRRWWPAGRQGRSGIQGTVRREVHLGVIPTALPSSWETSATGTARTQGQTAGPEDTWLPGRGKPRSCGTSGLEMAPVRPPERGHLTATRPGQALGPGAAESPLPALTRPASRPQATDRHQGPSLSTASRPGLGSPRPARQRSSQSQGAVIHSHGTNVPPPPARAHPQPGQGMPASPPCRLQTETSAPALPPTHTQAARAPLASRSAPQTRPLPPPLHSPPHTSPGVHTGCPRTPPPGNAGAQGDSSSSAPSGAFAGICPNRPPRMKF